MNVKRSLKAILSNDPMNEEVLRTVFTEAENIANSRPLTPNSSSLNDAEPLTPSHFLTVRPSMNIPRTWKMRRKSSGPATYQPLLEALAEGIPAVSVGAA